MPQFSRLTAVGRNKSRHNPHVRTSHRTRNGTARLYLAQIPSPKDVTDAGNVVATWPLWLVILLIFFVVLIVSVIVGIIVYRGLVKAQGDTNALLAKVLDKSGDNQNSYASAIATLATSVTTQQAQALQKDKADAERDKAVSLLAQGLTKQNELLESGNELSRKLTSAFTDSVSDTSTVVGAVGERLGNQITALDEKIILMPQKVLEIFEPTRNELVIKLDNLGPDVAKAIVPDIEHMFRDCIGLAKENDALTLEAQMQRERADTAERQLAALRSTPTEPDPPPSPDHKAAIPGDFDVVATLPRASGE